MRMAPPMMPMVAGVAASRTNLFQRQCRGHAIRVRRPCVTSVVSSATTGALMARARATSSPRSQRSFTAALAAVPLPQPGLGICASGRQQRLRSPAGDGEACRDDRALQAGLDRKPFEVRQDQPDAEGIPCAGLIHDGGGASVPTVKALVMRVVEDSAFRPALEDNEAEPAVDEARKRPMRIRVRPFEQEFIFAGKERVGVRQGFPPLVKRLLGDRQVRVDRDERWCVGTKCRQQCALHVERHRREMKCPAAAFGGDERWPGRHLFVRRAPQPMNQAPDVPS